MADEKKFADEKLTDDELDRVAGGFYDETANDSAFLYGLGLLDEAYTYTDISLHSDTSREQKIYDAFQKLGIGLTYHGACSNGYYAGQNSLTQAEAWALAKENAKKWGLGKYKKHTAVEQHW